MREVPQKIIGLFGTIVPTIYFNIPSDLVARHLEVKWWSLLVLNKSQALTLRKYSGGSSVKGNFFLQPYRASACVGATGVNLECLPTAQRERDGGEQR